MKNSILNSSIEKINKEFPNQWQDTINLIESLCTKKNIDITIYNPIQGRSLFLDNQEIEYAIDYINKELNQAKEEGYYSEMNFAIIIHQKTSLLSFNGFNRSRVSMCSSFKEGVFPVDVDRLDTLIPAITRKVDTDQALFYDFNYILDILKIKRI